MKKIFILYLILFIFLFNYNFKFFTDIKKESIYTEYTEQQVAEMGKNARRYFADHFDRPKITSEYYKVLAACLPTAARL